MLISIIYCVSKNNKRFKISELPELTSKETVLSVAECTYSPQDIGHEVIKE